MILSLCPCSPRNPWSYSVLSFLLALSFVIPVHSEEFAVELPPGVTAVWNLAYAYRETTPQQERICLSGLWRWQPADNLPTAVPQSGWGFFKVPGPWPGITDYMQKDCQTLYAHPLWKDTKLGALTAAWQEREISIPTEWSGRTFSISADYLNSFAAVYVDGRKAGEMRFPSGNVDITSLCRPGEKHLLSILVVAMPLKGVLLSYTDSASAREVKGSVARRGLCGDVYLIGTRPGPRLTDLKLQTSIRLGEITFNASLSNLDKSISYHLQAAITENGHSVTQFESASFTAPELNDGRFAFSHKWKPEKIWDIHTPQNQYEVVLSLLGSDGKAMDATAPTRFGFREFWIDGKDFYLNGTRLFLSAVPLDNPAIGAAWATYEAARESLARLKSFGINYVYGHNYGCEPGSHLSFAEVLRAADDAGMLVGLSQPHFSHYDWKGAQADQTNGYATHAEFYVRVAGNHPSVIFYPMSHNATGYNEDMNPDMIDGIHDPRDQWALNNSKLALRAEAIVRRLDPSRIVYHHASGNLGVMHDINFYPNFVPIQELSDWFGHWSREGVKPAFTCEYGAPFTWDWTMYRGWYKDKREFGSATVPWEFCLAEWNAQFLGDKAYKISESEKRNLRWEAEQFRGGKVWHRWDYPVQVGSDQFDEQYPVFAMYLKDNWRAFRTWGLSANSPWEYGHYWKLREGVKKQRQDIKVDWQNLQRPGYSPDYIDQRYERMDLAFEKSDWVSTPAAQALLRNNRPLLAYIGGKPAAFTSKDHNFQPGERIEKQIIIINNSREAVNARADWLFGSVAKGGREITIPTGDQVRIPIQIPLPTDQIAGVYELTATVRFSTGEIQDDSFMIDVVPNQIPPAVKSHIALFDPKGETAAWLKEKRISYDLVDSTSNLSHYETFIVGKAALTVGGPAPDIARVRDGLKVIVFEQTSEALEKRFGFRVEEYGLRQVFPRVPDHPLLSGISSSHLHDWSGEATLLSPQLSYEMRPRYGTTVKWCDIPVTRLWRCGNRGNVASVLIEKPVRGNFLPILDGGYALQYSPLLEFHEGKGLILFCQMDVTGRSEGDPAAESLRENIFRYVESWKPAPVRNALYVGDLVGKRYLEASGFSVNSYNGEKLSPNDVLLAGPKAEELLGSHSSDISEWVKRGGKILAIGLTGPIFEIMTHDMEHISTFFEPQSIASPFAGISPADLLNRDPRRLPRIASGAYPLGDGMLAANKLAVFCQIAPWDFDNDRQLNLKRTRRRLSFLLSRLVANMGVPGSTPILDHFSTPAAKEEKRFLTGLYLDTPEEWDDPYRFFRW